MRLAMVVHWYHSIRVLHLRNRCHRVTIASDQVVSDNAVFLKHPTGHKKGNAINEGKSQNHQTKHHLLENLRTCYYHLLPSPSCHPYQYTVYMTNRTSSASHCQGSRVLERFGHSDWPCEKQPTQRCTKAVRTTSVHVLYVLVAGSCINFPSI